MKCRINDLEINYKTIGEGKPIIAIHGFTPDHRLMIGCLEPILSDSQGYKRIYLDLPGMGKTQAKEWIKSSDEILQIVIDFIHNINPCEKFLLAGESYGGYIARGIVHKMADKVAGLFLLCPCIVADKTKRNLPVHTIIKRDDALLAEINPSDADDFSAFHVVQNKRTWERYRDEVLSGAKIADAKFLEQFQETGYEFSFDVDCSEIKFEKPTLILMGRQDSIVGYKDAWNILDNYPRATFAVLDQAGHNLQIEQEEVFDCLVKEWITRTEEYETS